MLLLLTCIREPGHDNNHTEIRDTFRLQFYKFTLKDEHSISKWRTYIFVISHFNEFISRKNVCTNHIFLIYSYIKRKKMKPEILVNNIRLPHHWPKYWSFYSLFLFSSSVHSTHLGAYIYNQMRSFKLSNLLENQQWNWNVVLSTVNNHYLTSILSQMGMVIIWN